MYPGVKFGVGPAVETGFYYDVDFGDRQISDADLRNVEKKMLELAKSKETFERQEVSKADALKYFTQKGDKYKCELIQDLEGASAIRWADECQNIFLVSASSQGLIVPSVIAIVCILLIF